MNQITTLSLRDEIEDLAYDLLSREWIVDGKSYNLRKRDWTFTFNFKKRVLGECNETTKTISLSLPLIEVNPDVSIWDDTMRHEIAHAIDFIIRGKSDHSKIWKNIGRQIGCDINFLSASVSINKIFGKYTYKCNHCADEKPLHRRTNREVACSKCCNQHNYGQYSDKFKLSVIQNY